MPRLSPSPSGDAPKLVIIGRDGVLNQYKEEHIKSPEEFEPIPGALPPTQATLTAHLRTQDKGRLEQEFLPTDAVHHAVQAWVDGGD